MLSSRAGLSATAGLSCWNPIWLPLKPFVGWSIEFSNPKNVCLATNITCVTDLDPKILRFLESGLRPFWNPISFKSGCLTGKQELHERLPTRHTSSIHTMSTPSVDGNTVPNSDLPSPDCCGWKLDDDEFVPMTTKHLPAPIMQYYVWWCKKYMFNKSV